MKIQLLMSILLVVLVGCGPEGSQSMNGTESVNGATANKTMQLTGTSETIPFMATPVAATSSRKENGPLTAITPLDNFQLQEDSAYWTLQESLIDELKRKATAVTLTNVVENANHSGRRMDFLDPLSVAGRFHVGFHYDEEDEKSCWMPQGLTGSADAGALSTSTTDKKLLAVSWHDEKVWHDGKCVDNRSEARIGARVSFIDVTDMDKIKYRHVLLVEPYRESGTAKFKAVKIHTGGIVWAGDYLYVADTAKGLRVFDMKSIMQVDVDSSKIGVDGDKMHAYGYEFILPQVGKYTAINGTSPDDNMLFSWASLDRSSDPPVLLTGEYNDQNFGTAPRPSNNGRAFLWPLNKATNKLDVNPETKLVTASSALYMNQHRIQGGFTRMVSGKHKFWFAGSHDSKEYKLYRKSTNGGLEAAIGWPKGTPQNMTYSAGSDNLWSLTESNNPSYPRAVWAVKLSDID